MGNYQIGDQLQLGKNIMLATAVQARQGQWIFNTTGRSNRIYADPSPGYLEPFSTSTVFTVIGVGENIQTQTDMLLIHDNLTLTNVVVAEVAADKIFTIVGNSPTRIAAEAQRTPGAPTPQVDIRDRYPHDCKYCGQPCYEAQILGTHDCSNPNCSSKQRTA